MFINHIYRHAREHPDRIAVVNDGHEITYASFACAIDAVRNHLLEVGLPDHGVITRLDRSLYLDWVLLLAVRSLGLTTVSGPSWQTIERLGLNDLTGVIGLSVEGGVLAGIGKARPDLAITIVPLSLLQPTDAADLPSPLPEGRFGNHIVYTSGTTGTSKKILRNGPAIDSAVIDHGSGIIETHLSAGDVLHCHGFETWSGPGYWNPTVCWLKGATAIFDKRPDWFEHFNDYPVALAFVVPNQLPMFRQLVSARPETYPPLKILVGGGFVNNDTVASIIGTPGLELFVAYGGTEFGVAAMNAVSTEDDLIWLAPTPKPGIEIVDDDDRPAPAGIEGKIRVKSMSTGPHSYLDDPEASAQHFRNGYFYPGDMAVQREDGRIRILGRVQDVLNLGGLKIPVEPVEASIRQALGVTNVCVFAVQDEQGRETLAVVLEARHFPDRAALQAAIAKAVRAPRLRVSKLDRFPRGENEMMKIDRRKVLELARASWSK